MLLGLVVTNVFHIPHPMWLFITLVVVLFDQSTVGGAIYRGMLRVSATLAAASLGFLVLIIFHNNHIVNQITILCGTLIFAYFCMDRKHSYVGVLGSITLIMILADNSGLELPFIRVITILSGTVVAILSMMVFFPLYAKNKIKQQIIDYLERIENTINIFISEEHSLADTQEHILKIESGLTTEITAFNRLADESRFESKIRINYSRISLHIRRINRLLNIIFLNLPNDDIRYDLRLKIDLSNLAAVFNIIRNGIILGESCNCDNLLTVDYSTIDIRSATDYELVFIYSTVNRIINETKMLIPELKVIGLFQND